MVCVVCDVDSSGQTGSLGPGAVDRGQHGYKSRAALGVRCLHSDLGSLQRHLVGGRLHA